jgi:hypothetical protein
MLCVPTVLLAPEKGPLTIISKEQALHKAEQLFSQLIELVDQASEEGWRMDELERTSFAELLNIGHL